MLVKIEPHASDERPSKCDMICLNIPPNMTLLTVNAMCWFEYTDFGTDKFAAQQ